MSSTYPRHVTIARRGDGDIVHDFDSEGNGIFVPQYYIFGFIWEVLNFPFSFVTFRGTGDSLDDGNWTGLIGMLQRGEADTSYHTLEIKSEVPIDYTYPVFYDRITFMTQKPLIIEKNVVLSQPFSDVVWLVFVFSTVAFAFVFCAMSNRKRCLRTIFSTLGNILGQPFSIPLTTRSHVFLFVSWILSISILIHSFKAIFLSFLTAVPTEGISTIEELASAVADGSVKCRTHPGHFIIKELVNSVVESHRNIGKDVYKNSKHSIIPNMYFDPTSTQRSCFIDFEWLLLPRKKEMFISEDSFFVIMIGFPLKKKFQGKNLFDKILKRMFESGLIQKIRNDFDFKSSLFPQPFVVVEDGERTITLKDFKGAFIVLGFGLGLASLVFLWEIVFFNVSSMSKQRNKSMLEIRNEPKNTADRLNILTSHC